MLLSVVIPTRERPHALRQCLARLHSTRHAVEIIVSDDGNVETTRQALHVEFPAVHFLQGPQRGPAANRNHGAAHATSDLLIFLDDDCIPRPDLLDNYAEAAEANPEIAAFEGRITPTGQCQSFADAAPVNERGGYFWTCNVAIRRPAFESIGGFDERFVFAANEDMDIYRRLLPLTPVLFLHKAQVFHAYELRLGERPLRHKGLSTVLYRQIHSGPRRWRDAYGFLRSAIRTLSREAPARWRQGIRSHPMHLLRLVSYDLRLALITVFWGHRRWLTPLLFRPCCSGCRQILLTIRSMP